MNKAISIAVVAASTVGATFADAAPPADASPPPSITVALSAPVNARPDAFVIEVPIRAEGATRVAALRAADERARRIRDAMRQVEGLTGLRVSDAEADAAPVRAPCAGPQHACPIVGQEAVVRLTVEASPAERAQALRVVLEDLGVAAGSPSFFLRDPEPAIATARRKAFEDGRLEAAAGAQAAGCTLGPLQELRFVRPDLAHRGDVVIVTSTRAPLRPSFDLDLETPDVDGRVTGVARFALRCA